jgi:hypothetical protein
MHKSEKGCVTCGEKIVSLIFRGGSRKNAKILRGMQTMRLDLKSRAWLHFRWRLEIDHARSD